MEATSLKNRTLKGVSWSFVDNIANSGISFLVGLVLANLLSPSEYGVLAMITIFIAISDSIIDCGFSSALVRKEKLRSIDLNTVFYFNLVVSFCLYFVLYVIAPYISLFFSEPILLPITRVLGCVLVVNALAIIQRTILVRNIDFKTQTKVSFVSSISSGIIGISMALSGCGAWSLVGQQISRQLFNTIFLWLHGTWRPAWEFSYQSFKELFSFGSKLLISGLIHIIYQNVSYFVIGRVYSAASLGQYTRAYQFSSIFSNNLTTVVQRVSYPVLSSIQNDPDRLRMAYSKIIRITMFVTFVCMFLLAAVAKSMILVLIGEKWLPAVQYLQILCLSGMFFPLQAINLNILQVKGRSDLYLKLEIIKKIIGSIPILLGVFVSITAMLWCLVVVSFVFFLLDSSYSASLIKYSTLNQIKDISKSFIVACGTAVIVWSVNLINLPIFLILFIQGVLGGGLLLCVCEWMELQEYKWVKQIVIDFYYSKLSFLHK